MKVEKFFKNLFFVVFAMTMTFNLTSCSDDDDDNSNVIVYTAKGNISASSNEALGALLGISDYTSAITKVLGNSYTMTEKDNKVISACDAVFNSHRTNHPTWKGKVEIEKDEVDSSGGIVSSVVIKTYLYE